MIDALIIISISFLTFTTRLINLLKIPIFTDEAIYIRWAQIGLNDPAHRYISLTDGKQPLITWLMYPFLKLFSDPLMAGRFVSVLSGVFAVIGLYLLTKELFGRKPALFAVLFYIISPFAVVYDRLALMDSLLAAFGIWSLYLEILLIRRPKLDISLLLGITVGLGYLTKSSALFYLLMMPFSLILVNIKQKKIIPILLKWSGFSIISIVIAQIMYNSLRLSPWFYIIKLKNYSFIMTVPEFIQSNFRFFLPNLNGLFLILTGYLTAPVVLVILIGLIYGLFKKEKNVLLLFLWFIFPFISLALFGKVIFPRFILFMTMPLFVIAGFITSKIACYFYKNGKIFMFILPLIFISPAITTIQLIVAPVKAGIPASDRNQLFDDWPSGYGVKEVINFIENESKKGKVVIGTEGTFGLNPASLEIYMGNYKNVEIYGFWPVSEVPPKLIESALKYPTYIMFKESQDIPSDWPLTLVFKYPRGTGKTFLLFYKIDLAKAVK